MNKKELGQHMVIISSEINEMYYLKTPMRMYLHETSIFYQIYQRGKFRKNDRGWAHYLENFTLKGLNYVKQPWDENREFISW